MYINQLLYFTSNFQNSVSISTNLKTCYNNHKWIFTSEFIIEKHNIISTPKKAFFGPQLQFKCLKLKWKYVILTKIFSFQLTDLNLYWSLHLRNKKDVRILTFMYHRRHFNSTGHMRSWIISINSIFAFFTSN